MGMPKHNNESPHRPTGSEIASARRNPPLRAWSRPELEPRVLWPSRTLGTAVRMHCVRCKLSRLCTGPRHKVPGRCLSCVVVPQ